MTNMNWRVLVKSKTFWAGVGGLVAAVGGAMSGEMTLAESIQTALLGIMGIFGRAALTNVQGNVSESKEKSTTPG